MWPILARTVRARPLRALLAAVAVAVAVATVLAVQVSLDALDRQAATLAGARAGRADLDVRAVAGRGLFAAEIQRLATVPGIARVAPLLEKRITATAGGADGPTVTVTLVGVDAGEVALRPVLLVGGRLPVDVASGRHEVALDTGVVDALSGAGHPVGVGSAVRLTTASGPDSFTVTGLTAGTAGGAALTRSTAFVTLQDASGPFALGLHTPLAALQLQPGTSVTAAAAAVHDALGADVVTSDPRAGVTAPLRPLRPLLTLIVVLSVLLGAGVSASTVAVATVERRRDIGLLRAAGASRRQVVTLLLTEAAGCAVLGALVGVAAGVLLGTAITHGFAGDGAPVPGTAPAPSAVLVAVLAGLAAALGGALGPATAASRVPVLTAVRRAAIGGRETTPRRLRVTAPLLTAGLAVALLAVDRAETAAAGAAALLLTVGLVTVSGGTALTTGLGRLLSPLAPRLPVAAAALARRRARAGLVIAGVAVAVATTTSVAALDSGAQDAGDHWVGHLFAGDAVVVSPATARDAVADQIATRAGLSVGRLRFLAAVVDGQAVGICAVDVAPLQDRGGLDVVTGDRIAALDRLVRGPAVPVPRDLADRFGWTLGSTLALDPGTGGSAVAVTVAAIVDHAYPAGDGREGLVMDRTQAVRALGPTAAGFDALQVVDGAAHSGTLTAIATGYGMQVTTVAVIRDAARASLGRTLGLLTGLSWAAVLLALLAVATTLATDIRLSTRDLALLRAVGLGRGAAIRLLLMEAGLLAVAGFCVGALTGMLVTLPLLRTAASPAFTPAVTVPVTTLAITAVAVLSAALLSAVLPARRAARATIVAAIRHE